MKKLLLLLAVMFVFTSTTFASIKTISTKPIIKREIAKSLTKIKYEQQEICVQEQVITISYYDPETHALISTNTYVTYIVDVPCLLRLIGILPPVPVE